MSETTTAATGLELYDYAMFAYMGAYIIYALHVLFYRSVVMGRLATGVLCLAWLIHTGFLVERALHYRDQYGGFLLPATNMFEAISYFAWLVVLLYLIAERLLKTRAFAVLALILPVAAMAYISQAMTPDPRDLMPSLKSYWLVFHISAMFISYAVMFLSFTFALLYIFRARGWRSVEHLDPRFNLAYLDEVSSRLVKLAFPLLTLGVGLGAVWANAAWGRFWAWDPKEVWALITWLIYLGYLHFRSRAGWPGYRSALLNCVGFVAVLITFLGVNYLDSVFKLNSIHAYTSGDGGGTFFLFILGLAVLIPVVMHFLPGPPEDLVMGSGGDASLGIDDSGAAAGPAIRPAPPAEDPG